MGWRCGSLNFLLFSRVSRSWLCIIFKLFSFPQTTTNKQFHTFLCKYLSAPPRSTALRRAPPCSAVLAALAVFSCFSINFQNIFLRNLLIDVDPRLLRPLHPGLFILRVPDAVQHGGGTGLLRRLRLRGLLLLLLWR